MPDRSSDRTADHRAPTPAQATAVRLPPRSSRHSSQLEHSHIRIVPHVDDDCGLFDEHDDSVPTFRSPSLQFTSCVTTQPRLNQSTAASLSQAKTFADMARRYHRTDNEEPSSADHTSPTGIVKLQPHRKTWRPMRGSDLSQCENAGGDDASDPSSTFISLAHPSCEPIVPHNDTGLSTEPTLHSEIQSMLDRSAERFRASCAPYPARADDTIRKGRQVSPSDECEHLFGKLPDLIRLQEQTGEFDGQVVFIGHPNRDISAHQWSSNSFQWVNIGRYAQARRRVEGSLACDSLKGYHVSQNPLDFFKHAAENREKLAVQEGRPKVDPRERISSTHPGETTRLSSGTAVISYPSRIAAERLLGSSPSTPDLSSDSIVRERLEDPFVAHARSMMPHQKSKDFFNQGNDDLKGSLDFTYELPYRESASLQPTPLLNSDQPGFHADNRQRRANTDQFICDLPDRVVQHNLRDISFGEDASGSIETLEGGRLLQKAASSYATLQKMDGYRMSRDDLAKPEVYTSYTSASAASGMKMSKQPGLYATARSLFPASGLTVANPRRADPEIMSSISLPTRPHTIVPQSESSSSQEPEFSTVEAFLKFSNPDGLRKSKEHAIAHGLSKQAPTAQNFKGPFFTDSKPTTDDPTAQLSVHVGEEEKLSTWFHDGHCPARQQEYAKTLISTAVSCRKGRKLRAVGEMINAQADADYQNTFAFVRLYENLSEYVDESRNDCGSTYFTRAWKTRSQHVSPNIGSYFSKPTTTFLPTHGTGGQAEIQMN